MQKIIPGFILMFFISYIAGAQSGFSIAAGTPVFITAGNIVSIDGLALTPSVNLTLPAPNNLVKNTTIVNPANGPYISRVYKWNTPIPSFTGSIEFYYVDAELNGIAENNLILEVYNSSLWVHFGTGVTRNATGNFVTTPGFNNYNLNELTLGSQLTPLPLQWGPVIAYRKNGLAYVVWNTYDEANTNYFEVESSLTGTDWITIGGRVPVVNGPGAHQYMQPDKAVTAGKTFYRIRELDNDGAVNYSKVVYVDALAGAQIVSVFPNPAHNTVTIQSRNRTIQHVRLYTADGKLLRTVSAVAQPKYQLDLAGFASGNYLLQCVFTDGESTTIPFTRH